MAVLLAYAMVVLIWSTTPLAIAWSGQYAGFLFGLSSRMLIGLSLLCLICLCLKTDFARHTAAKRAYLYGGLGLYSSMTAVYWAAQYIPSGWISVLFGFTPIFSALFAAYWLQERFLKMHHLTGMVLSLLGLYFIFASSLSLGEQAFIGVLGVLGSSFLHALSAVWVKKAKADVSAIHMTTGSLLLATPLFTLTWLCSMPDFGQLQDQLFISSHTGLWAIVYLAVFGSVLGFICYFFILKHIAATRVAFISLLTPISSLALGHYANHESLNQNIIMGTLMILFGLGLFELGDRYLPKKALR